MSADQRGEYLRWLASGRRGWPPDEGAALVFLWGLERRALADDADTALIVHEILRLRELARKEEAGGYSFAHYGAALAWQLVAAAPRRVPESLVRSLTEGIATLSEDQLATGLAWFVSNDKPLSAGMALIAARELPGSQRSVVVDRVAGEFRSLFDRRYRERWQAGLRLRVSKRDRRVVYQPQNRSLGASGVAIPNAPGIPSQFQGLVELWNSCVEDLRRYSRVAGDTELTVAAWEALPAELRAGIDHPLTVPVCKLAERHADEEGRVILPAGALAAVLGVEVRDRLTPRQSRDIAQTSELIGYGIEPDARLTGRSYDWAENVAMFIRMHDLPADPVRYGGAACLMQLGLSVAQADGHVDDEEWSLLSRHIEDAFELNEHETRRLEALRALLMRHGADISGLSKRIESVVPEVQRRQVGRLLVAIAAADGAVTAAERRALRRSFRALGLQPTDLDQTLSELMPGDGDGLVPIDAGGTRADGERIPGRPGAREEATLLLDRERIAVIIRETSEVAQILAVAMGTEEIAEPTPGEAPQRSIEVREIVVAAPTDAAAAATRLAPETPEDAAAAPSGRYGVVYRRLIVSARWSKGDADVVARSEGLMLAAAVERINDWAFERFGAPVLHDEGGELVVDREILEED